MMDMIFSGIYNPANGVTLGTFLISIAVALILGGMMASIYCFRSQHSRSFVVTLALLPATVGVVIMLVNGNLGAGVAVAGTFSLVRFRSTPGTAREITAIFLAMAVGLACGMGYLGFAALFAVVMCAVSILYTLTNFGGQPKSQLRRVLRITVPENLDYPTVFDDLFEKYTSGIQLIEVKTTNLGSLNRLTYELTLQKAGTEKTFIDELRCRNGNLEISMSLQSTESREQL
jgi:hypothetical protein